MNNSIWVEITPLWWRKGQHLDGISRTLYEYTKKLLDGDLLVRFCRYEQGHFIEVERIDLAALLSGFISECELASLVNVENPKRYNDGVEEQKGSVNFFGRIRQEVHGFLNWLPSDIGEPIRHIVFRIFCLVKAPYLLLKKIVRQGFFTRSPIHSTSLIRTYQTPFQKNDIFYVMGLLWTILPYRLLLKDSQQKGYQIMTVIHDLIPVHFPEAFQGALQLRDLDNVILASSVLFAPSDHGVGELKRYIESRSLPSRPIYRLRWGNNLPVISPKQRPKRFSHLVPGHFVLYVSSIGFRKNCEMLYLIWKELYKTNQDSLLPLLLVGSLQKEVKGQFMELVHHSTIFPKYISHEPGVTDSELSWLYENCRFTVYPSYYEGWGLPVSESLQYGKPCVCSDATSLPEAAAGFAECLRPFDFYTWKDVLLKYMCDDFFIAKQSEHIRKYYVPFSWKASVDAFEVVLRECYPQLYNSVGVEE